MTDKETFLNQKLHEQELSVRALVCLRAAGIVTVRDLVRLQRADCLKYRNFGKRTLAELDDFLSEHGLTWGMDVVITN
jgi:DNA-directed RNA polymerase subunit alpha